MWRHDIAQVASILMVEEQKLRNYLTSYQLGSIEALLKNNHQGSLCRLHEDEITALKLELENTIHLTTQSVIDAPIILSIGKAQFGISYTQSGMRDLLHRLGRVILDNARYHYSKIVKAYLETSRIKLIFLPSYSPNLNLIERLWKFFKKKVLYNKYYQDVKEFKEACIKFFRNIKDYHKEIKSLMSSEFELA